MTIQIDHLHKSYGSGAEAHEVLHDINLTIDSGEVFGILGSSGAGKSTLVRCINLLERPTSGKVLIDGRDITGVKGKELADVRAGIGMIFQDAGASLSPIRTIGAQIRESMAVHKKITKAEAKRQALQLFEKIGLEDGERIWRSYPFELSGGMKQRVGIALAMLMEPPVLLADEPTSALDVAVQKQVAEEMLHLREVFGTAIVLVTHDIGVVSAMADTVLVLKDGCVAEYGTAEQVLKEPRREYTKNLLAAVPRLWRK